MATTVGPTDGLVTRLLQQHNRNDSHADAKTAENKEKASDQVKISDQARQQSSDTQPEQEPANSYGFKQEKLESKLLALYTHHDKPESKG